jgi:hypothetical protein
MLGPTNIYISYLGQTAYMAFSLTTWPIGLLLAIPILSSIKD